MTPSHSHASDLAPFSVPADFRHPTLSKLRAFTKLESGWSFGEGKPLSAKAIEGARALQRQAESLGLLETDVFPGLNAEVVFAAYHGRAYLEYTVYPIGHIDFTKELDDVGVKEASFQDIDTATTAFKEEIRELWRSSASSTSGTITTGDGNGSTVSPSARQETRREFRLLMLTAFEPDNKLLASISEDTTAASLQIHRCSGDSTQNFYLSTA